MRSGTMTPRPSLARFNHLGPDGTSPGHLLVCFIMKTEKQKMLAGELYEPCDAQLVAERRRARDLLKRLNDSREDEQKERARIFAELIGTETDAAIQPPFFCDYGTNIA